MKSLVCVSALLASILSFSAEVSQAATVTINTFIDPAVYDFSAYPTDNYPVGSQIRAVGPVNMTWTASGLYDGLLDYQGFINLGQNAAWFGSLYGNFNGVSNGYAATTGSFKFISFSFDQPVSAVGGLINYGVFNGNVPQAILRIYGGSDLLLESFDLPLEAPITTPSGNSGAFRGFARETADIFRFELFGSVAIDDLTISTHEVAVVPLPATLLLLLSSLFGLTFFRRSKGKKIGTA